MNVTIQVVLISESVRLQQVLATYGIITQTPVQVEPIQVSWLKFCFILVVNLFYLYEFLYVLSITSYFWFELLKVLVRL